MGRYDYFWAQVSVQVTGIVFLVQLVTNVFEITKPKPGLEWVLPASAAAFAIAMLYALTLIVLNANARSKGK